MNKKISATTIVEYTNLYHIFIYVLKVASMIAITFNLNGGLLTTIFVYAINILYHFISSNKIICLSVCLSVYDRRKYPGNS